MTLRVLLAGILGGALMFAWQFVAHMFTPLGDMGMNAIPTDTELRSAIGSSITESGLYYFPKPEADWSKLSGDELKAAMEKQAEKIKAGPSGILIVKLSGAEMMSPRQLGVQFGVDVGASILAALLLAAAVGVKMSYVERVFFVTVMGFLAALVSSVPEHNWYNFPAEYTIGQIVMRMTEFLAAGLVLAALIRNPAATTPRA